MGLIACSYPACRGFLRNDVGKASHRGIRWNIQGTSSVNTAHHRIRVLHLRDIRCAILHGRDGMLSSFLTTALGGIPEQVLHGHRAPI